MYRIRLASGAETTYHNIEEFAAALHGGTVTGEALIYHQRADRWLSVTNHPHYQIALSRAPGAPRSDGSKRQVISAVRPGTEVPATRVAPKAEAPAVVRPASEAPRKLTIPTPKKVESGPLRAHENVLEGVVVTRPETPKTSVLPLRSAEPEAAKPTVKAAEPRVPDLGEGLDLVEDVADAPAIRPSMATPQVDKLLEMLAPEAPAAPAKVATPSKPEVELLDLNVPLPKPAAVVQAEPPAAILKEAPVPAALAPARGRQRTSLTMIGLGAAAVIALGAVMFFWKPWASNALPEGTDIASTTLPRTEAFGGSTANPAPTTAEISGTPRPSGVPADSSGNQSRRTDSAPAIVRVAAPRNIKISVPTTNLIATNGGSTLSISASELIQHYNVAYTEARSDLELRMLQIGFTQIFLRSRLTSKTGIQDTRRLIASATSALRQYRSQETQIERSYQDTIGVAGRNLGWTPRDLAAWNMKPDQKESGETLRLTNLMLSQMDSAFSLLAEQEGKYQISGENITFENPDAARQYGALRGWLNQQADKYAGSGDALPATLRQVVKAIGATRLPQERR